MAEIFTNVNDAPVTTLALHLDAISTSLTVADGSTSPATGNFRIRIDNEIMLVTGVAGNVWTVTRSAEPIIGVTLAAAHSVGANVDLVVTAGSLATLAGAGVSFDAAANLFIGGGGTVIIPNPPGFTGDDNIGIGSQSFDDTTIEPALNAITTGFSNVAIGSSALSHLTSGNYDVGIGESPMKSLTAGEYNTAIGAYPLWQLVDGDYNVAIGRSLQNATSGSGNTAVGRTGNFLVGGSNNTFFGFQADTTKTDLSSGIAIGANATVNNNNQAVIGGTGADAVCIIWASSTAPADADLVASQGSAFWDFTAAAAKLKIKGKDSGGTVFNATFSGTSSGTNTGDQTITLTGNVTGSGTGSFATTIAAGVVTNAMLAGSIAASKLVGTDITTVGTLSAGSIPYSLLTGTPTIPTAANPSATISTSAVNGSAATFMRSDAAPALASTITAGGPTGSATVVPIITYNAAGQLTAVTTATITQPSGANPTASAGLSAVNGSAATFMRSDGAPALDVTIAPTWTGVHTFAPTARTTLALPGYVYTGPADTGTTTLTERNSLLIDTSATVGWASGTGTLATQRGTLIKGPTYTCASAVTITNAATLAIDKAPVAAGSITITNPYALAVQTGVISSYYATADASGTFNSIQLGNTATNKGYGLLQWDSTNGRIGLFATTSGSSSRGAVEIGTGQIGTEDVCLSLYGTSYTGAASTRAGQVAITATNTSRGVQMAATGGGSNFFSSQASGTVINRGSQLADVTPNAQLEVVSGSASRVGLRVDSASSPTANIATFTVAGSGGCIVTPAGWFQNTPGVARTTTAPTNATNTMSNLSDLTVTLIAGRKYIGMLVIYAKNSAAGEGLQFDFNGGGASMTSFTAGFAATPPGASLALGTLTTTAIGTALTVTTATTADAVYTIPFTLVCNAGGTLIPRFAENSAHTSGTATVEIGSYIFVEDCPN